MENLSIKSSLDQTMQPSVFYPASKPNRPLIVALHTWGYPKEAIAEAVLPYAKEADWNLLAPHFRGPNNGRNNDKPHEACGSLLARQDIVDAVLYVMENYSIDKDNILLLGGSGGGHMALLAAGTAPKLFRACASFCPITDLQQWYMETWPHPLQEDIAACCGGAPTEENIPQYRERSPLFHDGEIAQANLKIFHGKFDPLVPASHSIRLYEKIIANYPESRTFLDIFDGGHDLDLDRAFLWFKSQMEDKNLTELTR